MKIILWMWINDPSTKSGHDSIRKEVDLPFVPRQGEAIIFGDEDDGMVKEVCTDVKRNQIFVCIDANADADKEYVEWLIKNDGWEYERI
jgi:hypothetical protein